MNWTEILLAAMMFCQSGTFATKPAKIQNKCRTDRVTCVKLAVETNKNTDAVGALNSCLSDPTFKVLPQPPVVAAPVSPIAPAPAAKAASTPVPPIAPAPAAKAASTPGQVKK